MILQIGLVILHMVSICMFSTFVLITACQLILELHHSDFKVFSGLFLQLFAPNGLGRSGRASRGPVAGRGPGQAGRGSRVARPAAPSPLSLSLSF